MDTLAASLKKHGMPADVTPVLGTNSTLITDTTAREILPAVAGKSYYITEAHVVQPTAAEVPTITIQDSEDTALFGCIMQATTSQHFKFDPPIKVTAGRGVEGKAGSAVGDTKVYLNGYVED